MTKKVNWEQVGAWFNSAIQSNSGKIIGGFTMIGFAILCKKLNIPFSVLSDPYGSMASYQPPVQPTTTIIDPAVIMVPNNALEASIGAICDNGKNTVDAYYKWQACNQIMEILRAQKGTVEESTKTYAIMCIRSIAASTSDAYYKNQMMRKIQNIAKGVYS